MQADVFPDHPSRALHLKAAAAAVTVAVLTLVFVRIDAQHQLRTRLSAFSSFVPRMRMNGNLLQRSAFSDPSILPIYGSSELDQPADNRPDVFFRLRPTGFAVFPEGHAGTTCLMLMQKIAAVGKAARGKKTVVFLSPSWFARPEVAEHTVVANLPTAQLNAWIFDSPLSMSLKEKIARRLRHFPDATRDQPLLTAAVRTLADHQWKDRCVFASLWPLGRCQNELSIGLEAGTLLWDLHKHSERFKRDAHVSDGALPPREMDWPRLAARAEARDRARSDGTIYSVAAPATAAGSERKARVHPQAPGSRDAEFIAKLRSSEEWHDLKLMTEVLTDLGAHVMFISQPINGKFYDLAGMTREARQVYYHKLANLVRPSGFPLLEYTDHEDDRFFFNDSGHPSGKAWIYYDQALDGFYHAPVP